MDEIDLEIKKLELGEAIAVFRRKKGLSLTRLAYEAGVSKGNLSDIEKGKKDPRLSSLLLIANGLDISVSVLFKSI